MQDIVKHLWGKNGQTAFWLVQIRGSCLLKFSLVGTDGLFHVRDSMAILLCFRCFWGTGVSRQHLQNSQRKNISIGKAKLKTAWPSPCTELACCLLLQAFKAKEIRLFIYLFGLCVKLLGYDLQKQWETQSEAQEISKGALKWRHSSNTDNHSAISISMDRIQKTNATKHMQYITFLILYIYYPAKKDLDISHTLKKCM